VAIAGSATESSLPFTACLRAGCPSLHGIGSPGTPSPEFAALANGAAAHSVEMDDTHQTGSIHPGVVIFSPAIALSEFHPKSISASLFPRSSLGYEVATRLAMAVQPNIITRWASIPHQPAEFSARL